MGLFMFSFLFFAFVYQLICYRGFDRMRFYVLSKGELG